MSPRFPRSGTAHADHPRRAETDHGEPAWPDLAHQRARTLTPATRSAASRPQAGRRGIRTGRPAVEPDVTISPAPDPAPGPTSAAATPDAGATAVDPAALARWSGAVPSPGPAADGLAAAARTLTTALHALLPAGPGRPPGGRSAPLAAVLAEHWTGLGRGWARDVEEHTAHVAVTGAALAEVDRAYDTRGPRR